MSRADTWLIVASIGLLMQFIGALVWLRFLEERGAWIVPVGGTLLLVFGMLMACSEMGARH